MRQYILLILLANLMIRCNNLIDTRPKITQRYKDIVQTFNGISVLNVREGMHFVIDTYSGLKKNRYSFNNRDSNEVFLSRDSIQFSPDLILHIDKNKDSILYKKELISLLEMYLRKMDSLGINSISSEFTYLGIDLVIYLKNGGRILFVSNLKNVRNEEWKKHIALSKKLEDHWYYFKE